MCKFTGSGIVNVDGGDMRVYDITFENGGTESLLASNATDLWVVNCAFYGNNDSIRGSNSHRARILGCRFASSGSLVVEVIGDDMLVDGCHYTGVSATYFLQDQDTYTHCVVSNNQIGPAAIDMGDGTDWIIEANALGGSVLADGGDRGTIVGNTIHDPPASIVNSAFIEIDNFSHLSIGANTFADAGANVIELDTCTDVSITGNGIGTPSSGFGYGILLTSCEDVTVTGNVIEWADYHGIYINGSTHCTITGNIIFGSSQDSNNAYDNIAVNGNRNLVTGNQLRPAGGAPLTRYGVNVLGGECNMIVGNDFGDPDNYGTDALADAGANTQLFYPNDGTYGDNFTDCGTGS